MLLLNVGPKPDGTLTAEETEVLAETGAWLKENGEGIYDTVPYKFYKEGEHHPRSGMFSEGEVPYDEHDFRFTYKNGVLYAFQMKPSKQIRLTSLHTDHCGSCVRNVTVLGQNRVASFTCGRDALAVELQNEPAGGLPLCLKIELS